MSKKDVPPRGVMLELYKDLAQPAARMWGKFFSDAASRRVTILRKNLSRTSEKLEKENPENITSPSLSVAMPIAEKMRYTDEETLVEAYAELLKNSCLKDRQEKVLPSYSTILSNLTSDEVKILDCINSGRVYYDVTPEEKLRGMSEQEKSQWLQKGHSAHMPAPVHCGGFPFLQIRGIKKSADTWSVVAPYFNDLDKRVTLSSPENIDVYIENLKALGIFSITTAYAPASIYIGLEKEAGRLYKEKIEQGGRIMEPQRGAVTLTPLAKSFLAMCTSQ